MQTRCPKHNLLFDQVSTIKADASGHPDCPLCKKEKAASKAGKAEK